MTDTDFGFRWEQVTVTRISALPDGYKCLRVEGAPGAYVDVYVTPKGKRVRVFRKGTELVAP
jgi:hypothetical protein